MIIPEKSFYFLRHGQTAWNIEGRFQGHTDMPLNEVGEAQARHAARALRGSAIGIIVASPLVRALKTAAIAAEALDKPLMIDSGLKERHFGSFEGLVVNEVKAKLNVPARERLVHQLPADAEQWHETRARTARVLSGWLEKPLARPILFVSHSGLFDALHEELLGQRIEPGHGPYLWRHDGAAWSCEAF